jgi:hypothetical protein
MFLKFPEEARLSPAARDLITRLMCDVDERLGTAGGVADIKAHPFFAGGWAWLLWRLHACMPVLWACMLSVLLLVAHPSVLLAGSRTPWPRTAR